MDQKPKRSWIRLPLALLGDSNLSPSAIIVYAIALDAAQNTGTCTISDITANGITRITAWRSIAALTAAGYIQQQPQAAGSPTLLHVTPILPPIRRSGSGNGNGAAPSSSTPTPDSSIDIAALNWLLDHGD